MLGHIGTGATVVAKRNAIIALGASGKVQNPTPYGGARARLVQIIEHSTDNVDIAGATFSLSQMPDADATNAVFSQLASSRKSSAYLGVRGLGLLMEKHGGREVLRRLYESNQIIERKAVSEAAGWSRTLGWKGT